jgi:hypothetical protein
MGDRHNIERGVAVHRGTILDEINNYYRVLGRRVTKHQKILGLFSFPLPELLAFIKSIGQYNQPILCIVVLTRDS